MYPNNIAFLIKFAFMILGSIVLSILAIRQSNRGQPKGWEHFYQAVEQLNKGEITEEVFNQIIKERR